MPTDVLSSGLRTTGLAWRTPAHPTLCLTTRARSVFYPAAPPAALLASVNSPLQPSPCTPPPARHSLWGRLFFSQECLLASGCLTLSPQPVESQGTQGTFPVSLLGVWVLVLKSVSHLTPPGSAPTGQALNQGLLPE